MLSVALNVRMIAYIKDLYVGGVNINRENDPSLEDNLYICISHISVASNGCSCTTFVSPFLQLSNTKSASDFPFRVAFGASDFEIT